MRAFTPWTALALAALAPRVAAAEAPRFPGPDTTVAVNRQDGRIAVLAGGRLAVVGGGDGPAGGFEVPGNGPRVVQFCGGNILYETHDVEGLAEVFVVITTGGRERLAFPNQGLAPFFPADGSRLTLDGRGVYGFLTLDPAVREFFGLPASIPLGAGVVATYRFAGEKMAARGSELFGGAVALSPDDMLISVKGGGLMRYRSPGGVAWRREGGGEAWRVADLDRSAGRALVIDGWGGLLAIELEGGRTVWEAAAAEGLPARDAVLLRDGRALAYVGGTEAPLRIVDPATGAWDGAAIREAFARRKLTSVLGFWMDRASSLAGITEAPGGERTSLLVRGADGWYELPLP